MLPSGALLRLEVVHVAALLHVELGEAELEVRQVRGVAALGDELLGLAERAVHLEDVALELARRARSSPRCLVTIGFTLWSSVGSSGPFAWASRSRSSGPVTGRVLLDAAAVDADPVAAELVVPVLAVELEGDLAEVSGRLLLGLDRASRPSSRARRA